MPVPFGFSVGDFAYAVKLILDVSRALKEAGGASAEFTDLCEDLDSLKQTLELLSTLKASGACPEHVSAISGMALSCQIPLNNFLLKIKKYEPALGKSSHHKPVRASCRKVQWALSMTDEVRRLRAVITGKVVSINLLLSTVNIKLLVALGDQTIHQREEVLLEMKTQNDSTNQVHRQILREQETLHNRITKREEESYKRSLETAQWQQKLCSSLSHQDNHARQVSKTLQGIRTKSELQSTLLAYTCLGLRASSAYNSRITAVCNETNQQIHDIMTNQAATRSHISTAFDSTQLLLRKLSTINLGILGRLASMYSDMLDYLKQILSSNMEIYRALMALHERIPKTMSLLLGDNIRFEDVLGRNMNLPYVWFRHWDIFEAMLRCEFKDMPGQQHVATGRYYLLKDDSRNSPVERRDWESAVLPGTKIVMSMSIRQLKILATSCPRPLCGGSLDQTCSALYVCRKCDLRSFSEPCDSQLATKDHAQSNDTCHLERTTLSTGSCEETWQKDNGASTHDKQETDSQGCDQHTNIEELNAEEEEKVEKTDIMAFRRIHIQQLPYEIPNLKQLQETLNPGVEVSELYRAAVQGDHVAVWKVVSDGYDVNTEEGHFGNALQAAAWYGYEEIVQTLLSAGANPQIECGHYGTALQAAASTGHENIVNLLLDHGSSINTQCGKLGNPLQAAALHGHHHIVKTLIKAGSDTNALGGYYGTALQAAAFGSPSVVKLLLANGANANTVGGKYDSAILASICNGSREALRLLLEHGADVNRTTGHHLGYPLHAAALYNRQDAVKMLLASGADVNANGGEYGHALQAAARSPQFAPNTDILKVLLDNGAHVNAKGGEYCTALQAAAEIGKVDAVRLLLKRGAAVNIQGGSYGCALRASRTGSTSAHLAVQELLLQYGALDNADPTSAARVSISAPGISLKEEVNPLIRAAETGDIASVTRELGKGTRLDSTGGKYGNALQAASWNGHKAVVEYLLNSGADVNAIGGFYGNALQAAAARGHRDVAMLLLVRGADIFRTGGEYGNVLQAAIESNDEHLARIFIQRGIDINIRGGAYGCALQSAAWKGTSQLVKFLIDSGADVNTKAGGYGFPIQAAALRGSADIVQILLLHGADPNAIGGEFGTALQAAACNDHQEVVQVLLRHGAQVNLRGGRYGSALCAAASHNAEELVAQFLSNGADANVKGGQLGHCLQAAASKGNIAICALLLRSGADVNACGGFYGSALQAACSKGHLEVVEMLLNNGADVNMKVGSLPCALLAAANKPDDSIVRLLLSRGAKLD